ncbi:winged helix DNA-binding domain-containing protein [Shewanella profunda]|uniref:winged helix-turn-helix domain-containing protein n=1 Tax=Shewanella profunda TaxID=254793 RepID=UPI00200F65B5|nr:crosslink repair DNA glycosylase YcaQ family protein [Shewanella profunda]MCL1091350.1 winged helix DNA-binding domain-containing protein [Shewanella profunda]
MSSPFSPQEWRRLNMQQQGLLQSQTSVSELIARLSYVQIDSINVVERAHHHVLHSRIPDYRTDMLDTALAKGEIFEYWSHAAAYLPIADYRFSLHRKRLLQDGGKHWFEPDDKVMQAVRARILAQGPLKASDFEHSDVEPRDVEHSEGKNGAWWDWKPAKKALEQLFMRGELMVVRREKFQKVYDLTARVLPKDINTQAPTDREFARYLIERHLEAHAFGNAAQIAYLRKGIKPLVADELTTMLNQGQLASFKEAGQSYFYRPELQLNTPVPDKVWLLNPFDNLLIQRQRLRQWFDFEYQIEVYVPAEKRQYGYYSLAILWRDTFVGRVDVKAERKQGLLLLQQLTLEEAFANQKLDEDFIAALEIAITQYAQFNGCERWCLVKSNHRHLTLKQANI